MIRRLGNIWMNIEQPVIALVVILFAVWVLAGIAGVQRTYLITHIDGTVETRTFRGSCGAEGSFGILVVKCNPNFGSTDYAELALKLEYVH
jgi:hypothetical protein